MKNNLIFISLMLANLNFSQTINLNSPFIENNLRDYQVLGITNIKNSFSLRPLNINSEIDTLINYGSKKVNNNLKLLPIEFKIEYSSNHPYSRNNGILIPNRGYQQLLSAGIYYEKGPVSFQFKPEFLFSENKSYESFWSGHYPAIINKRAQWTNYIDLPETFGEGNFKDFYFGQSSLRLNYKNISLGLSTENIWWGPAIRNSIMMSNNARGFEHITLNSINPIDIKFGHIEFQFVTGKLVGSNYDPTLSDYKYANHLTWVEKNDDWRFFQGINFIFSPKFIEGFSIGVIRWVQAYNSFININNDYFPVFDNLFRKNDKYGILGESLEIQRDQAAGIHFRWLWKDSKAEIYGEYYHNDSKANLRDLLVDSDHSRAATIGLQKIFKTENDIHYKFFWEWTQLEQTAGRLLRNAGSWYLHGKVSHGFTNRGEILGASIGPGSNSHFLGFSKFNKKNKFGVFLEIIDQDNDFFYSAFENAKDFRRYWKDFNIHFNYEKKINNFHFYLSAVYSRSLNYQWGLDDTNEGEGFDYYIPGIDKNNLFIGLNCNYQLNF